MRAWRLASAVKVVERIKGMLLAERMGAEWEILEGEEWADAAGTGGDVRVLDEVREEEGEKKKRVSRDRVGEEAKDNDDDRGGEMGVGRTGFLIKTTSIGTGGARSGAGAGANGIIENSQERQALPGGSTTTKANGWTKLKSRSSAG